LYKILDFSREGAMRGFFAGTAALLGAAFLGTAAMAQTAPQLTPAPVAAQLTPAPVAAQLTSDDVQTWLDGFMPYALQRGEVAGAVVVVVKDGKPLFEKGYGYADIDKHIPVDPKSTLFRPGSTSKLFTWTAVMQLVEQGKLDLDKDVNSYLDFTIPPYEGKPITLRNIMTHTAGFEETVKGLITEKPEEVLGLGEAVKRWIPDRIYAPGTTPAYSNYATALAGYIIERMSGEPFDVYIKNHIFTPLEMEHSSFRQPLPDALKPGMAQGYPQADVPPHGYEMISLSPAGSLAATGDDLSRFMIAHLQDGAFGDKQILKPETARQMHSTALTIVPHLPRMDLGFYEQPINGHMVIGHGGDTEFFHSYMWLYPDDHVGLFISMNSAGKEGAAHTIRQMLFEDFSDRYFPGAEPDGKVDEATAKHDAALLAGNYENTRRADTNFLRLLSLIQPTTVSANADGTVSMSGMHKASGEPKHYREIAPFFWREVDGHGLLSAIVENGAVKRFSVSEISPFMMLEPFSGAMSPSWLHPAAGIALTVLVLTLIGWFCSIFFPRSEKPRAVTYRWVRFADLAAAVVISGWGGFVVWLVGSGLEHTASAVFVLHVMQILSVVCLIGGLAVTVWNAKEVLGFASAGWHNKVWAVLQALSLFILLWIAIVYHLIGFSGEF
jgi:CubicO group peptidase (beta-lactamase class C family)